MKFAMQGAQDNGEFFTPPSLVQTIVNVIEPDHGIVFDPACGSGGMFVQSSHFIERQGLDTAHRVVFRGQEKTRRCAVSSPCRSMKWLDCTNMPPEPHA